MATGLRIAAWSGCTLLVMGAAAGTAEAVSGHSTSNSTQGAPPAGGPGGAGGPFGGAIKGQVVHSISTVKTKSGKYRKEEQQQGKVEEVTEESITVVSGDEYAQTYVLGSSTKYFKNGTKVAVSKIATGDTVSVSAKKVGSHFTAVTVSDGKPKPPKKGSGAPSGGFPGGGSPEGGGTPPTGQPSTPPTSGE
jgi:hypothetical protein